MVLKAKANDRRTSSLATRNFVGLDLTTSDSTFCNVWGFPVRRLLLPPTVLRLCTDLWAHGSGLVSLDQMGLVPPSTTTKRVARCVKAFRSGPNEPELKLRSNE
ncbi:hypothetical protein TNCV_3077531 [Trichonephila clavipes]|nr:hypothetical protein TNCV_3077531 [Trichonephila clavipes]